MAAQEAKSSVKQGKKGKNIVVLGIIAVIAIGLFMPISNLIFIPQRPALSAAKMEDPHFKAAGAVLQVKCLDCHTDKTAHPWYFSLPGAKGMINKDIEDGIAALDMSEGLFGDVEFSAVELAKLESTTHLGSMPPQRYTVMHWNTVINGEDKENIFSWIRRVRAREYAGEGVDVNFAGEVIQPLPMDVTVDEKKAALGEKLYNEKRLSADNTIACVTCHGLDKGGTDQSQFATGIGGQVGPINTPTVYNSSYNFVQFWDGRAKDLKEQAGGPVTNPIEMGETWETALPKIKADPDYQKAFDEVYGGNITEENLRDAIATFEETLITPNSRFDQYLRGKVEAVNADELKGYDTFIKVGCTSCHLGPAGGGTHYEKMGLKRDYFSERGNLTEADNGRYNETKKESDRHKFKVPILRNIEVTYPYLHDGSTKSLAEAVEIMGKYQLDKPLTGEQVAVIEKFLLTLTGKYQGKSLAVGP